MTLQEFKAWFEGFTEGFNGKVPTVKQWERVCKRVKEIDGAPVTERVYIDRYWTYPHSWRYYTPYYTPYYATYSGTSANVNGGNANQAVGSTYKAFNSMAAMHSLGIADSKES